jgi:hypothetical protein
VQRAQFSLGPRDGLIYISMVHPVTCDIAWKFAPLGMLRAAGYMPPLVALPQISQHVFGFTQQVGIPSAGDDSGGEACNPVPSPPSPYQQ